MLRTIFCSFVLLVFLTATPANLNAGEPAFGSKPNIIFIITDDQGYGDLSCHGNPILKTPNLDKLHAESVRFTRFQVSPTCAPTRSALMSGRHEFYVGVTHTILERERLALGVPTLPEMLQRAGYTTGIFGKWHLGDQDPYRPDRRGFDEVFIHGCGGIGQSYSGSCGDAPGNKYFNPWILHNNVFEKTSGFCTDVFFNQALSWIESQKGKKPFFAYITTNAPHGPLIAPDKYKKPFLKRGLNDRQAAYYGMIVNIDDNVGRLMARLKEWGIERDTLVIFITDNGSAAGWSYNAGMKGKKGSVDEGGTRVPCFFRWPGVLSPGKDVDCIAAHLDMLPTLAEIVGAQPREKEKLQGRSLVPLLKNPKADWKDRHLFSHRGRWPKGRAAGAKYGPFSVRSQRWRMVGRGALYDMHNDPGQKTNVIDKHPEVAAKMLDAYDRWWEAALPLLVNEDAPQKGPNTFKAMFRKQFGRTPSATGAVEAPEQQEGASERNLLIRHVVIEAATAQTPRSDTASIAELSDGRLMVVYHKYKRGKHSGHDHGICTIWSKVSNDGGRNWQQPRMLVDVADGDMNVQAPALLRLKSGQLLLICLRAHQSGGSSTMCMSSSNDEGRSFSSLDPVWKRSKGQLLQGGASSLVELKSGRLLLPLHGGSGNQWKQKNSAWCFLSDKGKTWQRSTAIDLPRRGAMESSVAQLADGTLLMSLRTQLGGPYLSRSTDAAKTWSEAVFSGLEGGESCTCLRRIPGTKDVVLFWNNSKYNKKHHHFGQRTPLTAAISSDNGRSWRIIGNIADDPKAEYTNLDCFFASKGDAILTYMYAKPAWNRKQCHLKAALIPRRWFNNRERSNKPDAGDG